MLSLDSQDNAVAMGQSNSHLVFDDTYVELTAVQGDLSRHHLRDAIARYWRLHIIVLRAKDAEAEQRALAATGSAAPAPALAARHVAYPGGKGVARFKWFRIPVSEFPEAFLCAVEHLDADLVFDPALNAHPNGACVLHALTLVADRPEQLARRMAAITGSNARPITDGWRVATGDSSVDTLDAAALAARYPGVPATRTPWLAGFSVRSRDPGRAARHLADAGIVAHRNGSRLWVAPDLAGGTIFEFVANCPPCKRFRGHGRTPSALSRCRRKSHRRR